MNHNNYFFLKHLAAQLDGLLRHALFTEAFSTSKEELLLQFRLQNGSFFTLKFNVLKNDCVLSFPQGEPHAKQKQPWFRQLTALTVQEVKVHPYERSFHISFDNNYSVVIKLHGKNGNIILLENGSVVEAFRRQLKSDFEINIDELIKGKEIDIKQALVSVKENGSRGFSFIPADAVEALNSGTRVDEVLQKLNTPEFFICKNEEKYQLRFFARGELLGQYTNAVDALNDFARLYLGSTFFTEKKSSLLKTLKSKKEKLEKELQSKRLKLEIITTQTPYSQLGDILMANLHALQKGMDRAKLFNFYTEKEIEIKLKKDLSPQQNAENYYRKSKNQAIEENMLKKAILTISAEIEKLDLDLQQAETAEDSKSLKRLAKEKEAEIEEDKPTLFKEFEFKGYKILVGKNSENNDLLTQKYAKKDDMWLHARGVAGSHVVIKTHAGKTLPADVLEYAAAIAAYYSKGKTDSLCPVAYTEKKYVRKPKGSHPGQVVLEKEKVLLVKPGIG